MAYNRQGYYKRAKAIQELTALHYERGRQDRNLKWVWRTHVNPFFGMCYETFLKYLYAEVPDNVV